MNCRLANADWRFPIAEDVLKIANTGEPSLSLGIHLSQELRFLSIDIRRSPIVNPQLKPYVQS